MRDGITGAKGRLWYPRQGPPESHASQCSHPRRVPFFVESGLCDPRVQTVKAVKAISAPTWPSSSDSSIRGQAASVSRRCSSSPCRHSLEGRRAKSQHQRPPVWLLWPLSDLQVTMARPTSGRSHAGDLEQEPPSSSGTREHHSRWVCVTQHRATCPSSRCLLLTLSTVSGEINAQREGTAAVGTRTLVLDYP